MNEMKIREASSFISVFEDEASCCSSQDVDKERLRLQVELSL